MSATTDRHTPDSPVDQRLPLTQLLLVGFQHVLLMYDDAVAVSPIVGQAADLSRREIAFPINASLLVVGVATLVRSLGIGPMDIHMLVMVGASFATVGSVAVMTGVPGVDITGVFGATVATGFFGILITPFMSRVVRFFPPLVAGAMITSISMCLFPVAINWASGGEGAEGSGPLHFLFPSSLALYTILLINRFIRGFWISVSVLIGMGLGYMIAGGMGMVDLGGLAGRPWSDIVTPLHFGAPTSDLAPILSMCLVVIIIFVESAGTFLALDKITGRKITPTELRRGLLCSAGVSFFAGFLNIFTHSSLTQNIGLVQIAGVHNRYVTVAVTGFLTLLNMLPKAAFLITSAPPAVLGGAGIAMFGMIAASSIQILHEASITDRRNQLLVAISIDMGMVPVVHPDFFAHLSVWMEPITHSGIAMTAIWAVVLNLLFSILSCSDRGHLCGSRASTPKHS